MLTDEIIINEKNNILPIKKNSTIPMKINSPGKEYSIKQTLFDPTKNSPPNEFINKLHMRMSMFYDIKNDNNLVIE